MSIKVIVSYDGTANEEDAIALGRVFARAGAEIALAYVRHTREADRERESLVQNEAEQLLERGAGLFGDPSLGRHVITDRSTPEGLRALAVREGADVIAFCSDSHTAEGHIAIGNSAERLIEGGPAAIAIAPVGLGARDEVTVGQIVAIGDSGGGAQATAESLASALEATVSPVANEDTDMLVIDSRPEAEPGHVSITASAAHAAEIATGSVLILPRGAALSFDRRAVAPATP